MLGSFSGLNNTLNRVNGVFTHLAHCAMGVVGTC